MPPSLRTLGLAWTAIAGILVATSCDDDDGGGSGQTACETLCAWESACRPTDGPAPDPLAIAPDPIGEGGTGGASVGCVGECAAEYREYACVRSTLPACASCLELHGCEAGPCVETCAELDDCFPTAPLDPPADGNP